MLRIKVFLKVFFLLLSASLSFGSNLALSKEIVDMAGRKVVIPDELARIYSTSPLSQISLYALAPEMLIGWCTSPTLMEKKYFAKRYLDLPSYGGTFGVRMTLNPEVLIKAAPQIIINNTMHSDPKLAGEEIESADRLQVQTGIPVVLLLGGLENHAKTFSFLGELLGKEEKAKELADYCTRTIEYGRAAAAKVPEEKRVRVYYAEGPRGLLTDGDNSYHAEILKFVRGKNVVSGGSAGGYGRGAVSLEQVIMWQPELIIVCPENTGEAYYLDELKKDLRWRQVKAVREGQIYVIPHAPFNWFDRPPGVNRLIGIYWLGNLLYPEFFDISIAEEMKKFFSLFYHYDLTDAEVKEILDRAAPFAKGYKKPAGD